LLHGKPFHHGRELFWYHHGTLDGVMQNVFTGFTESSSSVISPSFSPVLAGE
jgi:hypothetical protein